MKNKYFLGAILIIGLMMFFSFAFLINNIEFGTGASAYYDGEKNVECWDARVDDENIFGTYHYERKCIPYGSSEEVQDFVKDEKAEMEDKE